MDNHGEKQKLLVRKLMALAKDPANEHEASPPARKPGSEKIMSRKKSKLRPKRRYLESSRIIRKIRKKDRKETQKEFAKRVNASQATVTSWERGQSGPSPASCLLLAGLASEPEDRIWFERRAKSYDMLIKASEQDVRRDRTEIGRRTQIYPIPLVHMVGGRLEKTGDLFPVPAAILADPMSSLCVAVEQASVGSTLLPGDFVLVDTSGSSASNLALIWGQAALIYIDPGQGRQVDPQFTWGYWPGGLNMGRLLCKRLLRPRANMPTVPIDRGQFWVATLGPLGDKRPDWSPEDEAIYVGHWHGARSGAGERSDDAAHQEALENIRLDKACRYLGRVIGWFRTSLQAV